MKQRYFSVLGTCLLGAYAFSQQASAELIIDPDGLGWINVEPAYITTYPRATSYDYFFIGHGGPGAVEINADLLGNGYREVYSLGVIQVGASTTTYPIGGPGLLRVIGDGSYDSARVIGDDYFSVGIGGNGSVEIRDGGYISAAQIQLGSANYDADILVDGPNAMLESMAGGIRFSGSGLGNTRSLTVSNGASLQTWGVYDPGNWESGSIELQQGDRFTLDSDAFATFEMSVQNRGTVEVLGGASLQQIEPSGVIDSLPPSLHPLGYMSMRVGDTDQLATVRISDRGSEIDLTRNMQIGGYNQAVDLVPDGNGGYVIVEEPTAGAVTVENGANLNVGGTIYVSENGTGGSGTLTVRNGGQVSTTSVVVNEGGTLNGSGGSIFGDVILEGGTLAPGNSPGYMGIYGDLIVNQGVIDLEIAGTGYGEYDELNVLGSSIFSADTTINLHFINGFAPSARDDFNLVWGNAGMSGLDLATFNVLGLEAGFEYDIFSDSYGNITLFALNDGVSTSVVPVPAAVWLFGSGLIGLVAVGRRRQV